MTIATTCYAYFAISAGAVSTFFSVTQLLTRARLPFTFGYLHARVDLTVGDTALNTLAWMISLLGFLIYPVILREARSARLVLLSHGAVFLFIISAVLWPDTIPLLAVANIVAYLIALGNYPRVLNIGRTRAVALSTVTLLGFLVPLETFSFFVELTNPFVSLVTYFRGLGLFAATKLDLGFFYVGYSSVSLLMVMLIVSPIIVEAANRWIKGYPPAFDLLQRTSARRKTLALAIRLVGVSAFAGSVALLPWYWTSEPVGVDLSWYYAKLSEIGSKISLSELVLVEPRAAYLLIPFTIRSLSGIPIQESIILAAGLLSMLFAVGTFFASRETGLADQGSILAALFAGVSAQTLIATKAAIFAGWLAMAEMMFFFAFLLRAIKSPSISSLIASFVISLMIMVTHTWTWAILMLILTIHVALSVIQSRSWRFLRSSAAVKILAASAVVAISAFVIATSFKAFHDTIAYGFPPLIFRILRPEADFFGELQVALAGYAHGAYSNWLMLSLAIVGVFSLVRKETQPRTLLGSWILGPSLLSVLVGADMQWRLLFLIPYHMFAALGVSTCLSMLSRPTFGERASKADILLIDGARLGLCALIVLLFLNNAVRSMALIAVHA